MTLRASFITLFPDELLPVVEMSVLGRGQRAGLLDVERIDLRSFAMDKHKTVDDSPSGGGAGMVMRVDVIAAALDDVKTRDDARGPDRRRRVVLVDARGAPFRQSTARRLASVDHLVFICGRYEGVDARVEGLVDEVLSLGDFVLSGGELAALAMFDAAARLVPGVLGNAASPETESHTDGLLEHRQYTRPVLFRGEGIPPVLQGGNHADIDSSRKKDALVITAQRRPDLFVHAKKTRADDKLLRDVRVPTLAPERKA